MHSNLINFTSGTVEVALGEQKKNQFRPPHFFNMTTVIATGCPLSGWQKVLPVLEEAGLESRADTFARWHDELFRTGSMGDPLPLPPPLEPEPEMRKNGSKWISEEPANTQLLTDNRSLWLLDYWSTRLPDARFILFYSRAEEALANACRQGSNAQHLIEEWQTVSHHLLKFQRRHRRRVLLLDAEAAVRNPQAVVEICQRIGISLQPVLQKSEPIPAPSTIERFLAQEIIAGLPQVQALQTEMEASAHPLGDPPSVQLQPLELLNDHGHLMANARQQQQKLIESEKAKIDKTEHLDRLQNEKDELIRVHDVQVKMTDALKTEHEQLQEEYLALEAEKKEAVQENDLLLLKLHQVQEELEGAFLKRQQLERAQNDQKSKHRELQVQIKELTKSRDELAKANAERDSRLEQMQKDDRLLKTDKKETDQENKLLLRHLHQVQEEHEALLLRHQNLKQASHRLERSQKESVETNGILSQELQLANKALVAKESENEKQRQRLTKLKKTVSWKITAPLRVMAKPFNTLAKERNNTKNQINLLKSSGHFDEAWYLSENDDVANLGDDPVEHYIRHGAAEGRNPAPTFNTQRYLDVNPDVADSGMNPLVHFVKYGMTEERCTN